MIEKRFNPGFSEGREYHWFILLFVCMLPLEKALSNLAIVLLAVYVIYTFLSDKVQYSFSYKAFKATRFLPALFALLVLSLLYSTNFSRGISLVGRVTPLLIIPVVFSFICFSTREKKVMLLGFAMANVGAIIINVGRAFVRSIQIVNGDVNFDASVLGGQPFWYSIVQGGNYFFYEEVSYFLHPTYWAIYMLFCVFIVLKYFPGKDSVKKMILFGGMILLFLTAIFLCSSRIIIVSAILFLSLYFIALLIKKKKFYWLVPCVIVIVISAIALFKNPRFAALSNFSQLETFNHVRLEAWRSAIIVYKQSPVFGVGIGDIDDKLMEVFVARNFVEGIQKEYNEHNQYLQIANATGITGLVVFLFAIGHGFKKAFVNKSYTQFVFIASMTLVCLVEDILIRSDGVTYFSFFFCLLFVPENEPNKDLKTENP